MTPHTSLSALDPHSPVRLFPDDEFRIVNVTDTSKQLAFDLSAIATGTTRTVTMPDASGTVALLERAQTFTKLATFALGLTVAGAAFASRGIQDDATTRVLTLSGSGANSVTIANSASDPAIGTTGGALMLQSATGAVVANGGANVALFYGRNTANANGAYFGVDSSGNAYAWNACTAAGSFPFYVGNGSANNTGPLQLVAAAATQVLIPATAGANRYITLTGSNGANPTIGTSAGDLAIASTTGYLRNTAASTSIVYSVGTTGSGTFVASGASGQVAAYQMLIGAAETARMASNADGVFFSTGSTGANTQVAIAHTASANRYITLTGSNGGSPTIGTSGGSLQLSSGASAGAESYIYSLSNLSGSTPALASATGLLIGANKSAGNGDVVFFNPYYIAAISFDFRQITASGVSASVARMLPISGGTAGLVFVQGSGTVNARIGTDAASNIIIGSGIALSTSATTNHMMIPTCAGTPTGIPVDAAPGRLPLIYDTTNNKLYAYNGAWKSTAALT